MAYSVFSVLWLSCGLIALLSMLAVLGTKAAFGIPGVLKWTHRIFGALFMLGYVAFLIAMVPLYQANAPGMPPQLMIHAYLGIVLLPLILVKELIARFFKRFYAALPYLGIALFAVAFAIVGLTGLHQLFLHAKGPRTKIHVDGKRRKVNVAVGRELLHSKCARCHELKTVYIFQRTEDEWRDVVARMVRKDPDLTSTTQANHIVGYLKERLGSTE